MLLKNGQFYFYNTFNVVTSLRDGLEFVSASMHDQLENLGQIIGTF